MGRGKRSGDQRLRSMTPLKPTSPDHVPHLAGDTGIRRAGTAYCIAIMRAWLRKANEEVG